MISYISLLHIFKISLLIHYRFTSLIKFITPKSLLCASLLCPFIGLDSSQLINPDQGIPSIMKHLPEVRIFLIGATKTN